MSERSREGGGRERPPTERLTLDVSAGGRAIALPPWSAEAAWEWEWGLFRGDRDPARWARPAGVAVVEAGSAAEASAARGDDKETGAPTAGAAAGLRLRVPRALAPVSLGVQLLDPASGGEVARFAVPVGMGPGRPEPLGATVEPADAGAGPPAGGDEEPWVNVNFAVAAPGASALSLHLARLDAAEAAAAADGDGETETLAIALDPELNRTGDVWHVHLPGLAAADARALCFGSRAERWVADPAAKPERAADAERRRSPEDPRSVIRLRAPGGVAPGPLAPAVTPCGQLAPVAASWPWPPPAAATAAGGDPPTADDVLPHAARPWDELVAYALADDLRPPPWIAAAAEEEEDDGTVASWGAGGRLAAVRRLGATAVVLPDLGAPESLRAWDRARFRAAAAVGGPERELAAFVGAAHAAGLDVFATVDCGRLAARAGVATVATGWGKELAITALRDLVATLAVDGLVLARAEHLCLDARGRPVEAAPAAEELAHDPLLAAVKLVADVGDPARLPRGGRRGFPHHGVLGDTNPRFPRDVLAFLAGGEAGPGEAAEEAEARLGALAQRLAGSGDLFQAWEGGPPALFLGRPPALGFNRCRADADRRPDPPTAAARGGKDPRTVARAAQVACFVAPGVPVVGSGEEVAEDDAAAAFVAALAAFRARHLALLQPASLDGPQAIRWHGVDGAGEPAWEGGSGAAAGVLAFSRFPAAAADAVASGIYAAFNGAAAPAAAVLPAPPRAWAARGGGWAPVLDAARPDTAGCGPGGGGGRSAERLAAGDTVVVAPGGAVLLEWRL